MTIKDIARLSGYAVGTVSRVLNGSPQVSEAARNRIMAVVHEHNFKLNNNAKHLKHQASKGIAIIVKGTQNMLFAGIMERLQNRVIEQGFASLVYYIDEEDNEVEQALQICRERHPQGVLFLGSNLDTFRRQFSSMTIPCVLVTNSAASLDFSNLSSVSTDDAAASEFAVEHLISLGHRNIAIIGGKMDQSNMARIRYEGCLRAFERHGISFDQQLQYMEARFSLEDGRRSMHDLLDRMPQVSAVFAMSDVIAMGAMRAICDRGLRVPDDISVMGFDGIDLVRYLNPELCTIRQHKEHIADRSVDILTRCIHESISAVHEVIEFDFVNGESVKALEQNATT